MELVDERVISNIAQLVGPLPESDSDGSIVEEDDDILMYCLLDMSHEIRVQLLTELLADTLIYCRVHLKREVRSG